MDDPSINFHVFPESSEMPIRLLLARILNCGNVISLDVWTTIYSELPLVTIIPIRCNLDAFIQHRFHTSI